MNKEMSKQYDTTDSDDIFTPVFKKITKNEENKSLIKDEEIKNESKNNKNPKRKIQNKKKRVIFSNLTIDDVIYRVKHSKHRPNYYFWGTTGSGKTYCAYKIAASLNRTNNDIKDKQKKSSEEEIDIIMEGQKQLYKKALSQYWRNYHGEKVILMDDITTESTKFFQQFLKTWGNMYPFEAITDLGNSNGLERRNVTKMIIDPNKYTFIITSNKPPEEIFTFNNEEFERFNRLFYTIHLNSYFTGLFDEDSYISSDEDTDSAASEKKTVTIQTKQVNNNKKKGISLLHDDFEDIYPTMEVIDEIPTIGEVVDHHGYDATDPFINDNSISEESEEKEKKNITTRVTTKVGDTFKKNNLKKTYGLENIPLGLKSGINNEDINNDTITNKIIQIKDNKPIIINNSKSNTDSDDETYQYEDKSTEEYTLESSESNENDPIVNNKSIITTEYDNTIKTNKMKSDIPKKELRKYSEPKEYLGKGVYYNSKIERERRNKKDDTKLLINNTKMNKKDIESKPKKNEEDEDFIIHRIKNPELINALQRIKNIQKEIQDKIIKECENKECELSSIHEESEEKERSEII